MKPFAQSCVENWQPILSVLKVQLPPTAWLLEIGSGTGQHAVYCAPYLPGVLWQTSDCDAQLAGIHQWLADADTRVLSPFRLDVLDHQSWPDDQYDAVFTANTFHIMHWEGVVACFELVGQTLRSGGRFLVYGPFNYGGEYTSESNERFDHWLKSEDPQRAIRDVDALKPLAAGAGLSLHDDIAMPANNRILVWQKH